MGESRKDALRLGFDGSVRLALPVSVKHGTLTTLRNKLVKVMPDAQRVVFQLAEVAIPRSLFALILRRIERLRLRLLTPAPPAPT